MAIFNFFRLGTSDRNRNHGNVDGYIKSEVEPAKQIFCKPFGECICCLRISPAGIGSDKYSIYKLGCHTPGEVSDSYAIGPGCQLWSCFGDKTLARPSKDFLGRY